MVLPSGFGWERSCGNPSLWWLMNIYLHGKELIHVGLCFKLKYTGCALGIMCWTVFMGFDPLVVGFLRVYFIWRNILTIKNKKNKFINLQELM